MTITLNHTILPAHNKQDAARWFAETFGLVFADADDFAPVRVNETLTLLFADAASFEARHYAFHVSDLEFDAILGRVKDKGIGFGSAPWSRDSLLHYLLSPTTISGRSIAAYPSTWRANYEASISSRACPALRKLVGRQAPTRAEARSIDTNQVESFVILLRLFETHIRLV